VIVFLSHNKADRDTAREIALFLVAENVNVWFDEWEIAAGDSIVEQINEGLKDASHFIILWSAHSSSSHWVRRELQSTLAQGIAHGRPRVLPIVLDDTPLPRLIADLKYIPYHGGTEEDRRELIRGITGHAPSQNLIKAIVKKYHEVIHDPDARDPFGLVACPQCGSNRLRGSSFTDYARDDLYYILQCEECGWSDWTQ
jgi:hypothetical protein